MATAKKTPKAPKAKKAAPKAKKGASNVAFMPGALDPRSLGRMARQVVIQIAQTDCAGADKHARAVAAIARKIDAALIWPATPAGLVAEALDGIAARILLGAVIKHAYNALKSEGKIR